MLQRNLTPEEVAWRQSADVVEREYRKLFAIPADILLNSKPHNNHWFPNHEGKWYVIVTGPAGCFGVCVSANGHVDAFVPI